MPDGAPTRGDDAQSRADIQWCVQRIVARLPKRLTYQDLIDLLAVRRLFIFAAVSEYFTALVSARTKTRFQPPNCVKETCWLKHKECGCGATYWTGDPVSMPSAAEMEQKWADEEKEEEVAGSAPQQENGPTTDVTAEAGSTRIEVVVGCT